VESWTGTLFPLLFPQLIAMQVDAHNKYVCFSLQLQMTHERTEVVLLLMATWVADTSL
jgi:hypothetical protein